MLYNAFLLDVVEEIVSVPCQPTNGVADVPTTSRLDQICLFHNGEVVIQCFSVGAHIRREQHYIGLL